MLLLLVLLHNVFSRDIPKQSSYVTKLEKPCPNVGYYFERAQVNALPGSCYLCFCKENNTAVCWPRDNKRCDEKYYRHFRRRDTRRRRSLPGDNITLENNIQIAKKAKGKACKPNEASFSEGCPPDDWCKGCTVCDCNKDGRWDCHILSFCPENSKFNNSKKGNSRRVYKMKGVTKANPTQAVKFDKTKRFNPNLNIKERIIRREATRRIKQSKRRKNVYHPAATPRGQTYKTTTRSRHRGRNPAAGRRMAKNMKAKLFKDLIKYKSTERKPAQRRDSKQNNKLLPRTTKKPQLKKTPPPKQITQHIEVKLKNNQSGKHSNSKVTVKNDKIIALTKTLIEQTTPITKQTAILKTTKSTESSKYTKVTKVNVLTTTKPTTKTGSTISKQTHTTIAPAIKVAQQQQTGTTIAKVAINNMLNQQILTASKSKGAKVNKRSLIKKIQVAKSKKLTQVHANKTKTKNGKTVLRKLQKRSKIYFEKSSNMKINKRHKRGVYISAASNKTLDQATVAEFGYPQNTLKDFKQTTAEKLPPSTEVSIAYYRYTIDNLNKTTGVDRIDFTRIIPLNSKKSIKRKSLDMGKELSNLNKATNTFDTSITLLDVKNFTISNWSSISFQNNETLPKNLLINTTKNISGSLNAENFSSKTEQTLLVQKINTISKEPTIISVPKKHKFEKTVSILANKSLRIKDFNQTDMTNRRVGRKTGKLDGLKKIMHNIVTGINQNNKSRKLFKNNRFKIIKYLKKFFKNLFSKMKRKERINNKTVLPQLNKKSVIETLCETFGPCNINLKNKKILQRDIEALNAETYKMLKSIKIIKGLLKFLDFAKTDRELPSNKNVTRKTAFKYDIHKLHSILIGTYITEENFDKLTETQKCQLDYVKNNTQSFIKSATRFSLILNDIINILTTVNANVAGQNNMYAKVVNDTVAKSYSQLSAEKVENFTRISRDALGNETIKTGKIYVHDHGDPFNKIKKLILKYNLLQNIFMKKIYKLIGSFDEVDVKAINKVVGHTTTTALNVSHDSLTNRTEAIRTYSKNVIKNLRKLKDLARRLTSKNRKKRELEDDDSLEYLLTLMEYLLKQNHPLDTFPVNDGIDLLIDAIKQAPQIKSVVVKKVLDVTTTESSKIKFLTEVNSSESSSDIKFSKENIKFSKEDIKFSKEDNSSSQAEEFKLRYHKFNLNGQSIDDEEGEDSFLLNKRAKPHPSINVPEYYTIHKPTTPAIKALLEGSLSFTTDIPKKLTPSIVFATSGEIARQADFEKDEKKDNSFKFDVFDGDVEEVLASSSTVSPDTIEMTEESNPESPIVDPKATSSPSSVEKEDPEVFRRIFRDSKTNLIGENIEPGDVSVSQSKSNLDWMEETYEEEEKGANRTAAENTTQNKIYAATEVAVHRRKLNRNDNISNISKDEEQKRTKQSAEDLIYRKEMNLLNSLDYGTTEKSEKQGSNSNESTEDKYTVDTFDVYFN